MKSLNKKLIGGFFSMLTISAFLFGVKSRYQTVFSTEIAFKPNMELEVPHGQALLITFGRSGSTFTSDIIGHHKDVFYTFEPLSFLIRPLEAYRVPMYFQTVGLEDYSKKVIESFLTCRFDVDTLKALVNRHLYFTESTKDFAWCFQESNKTGMEHLDCYFDLVRTCRNRSMKFVKTIRFPVKWAKDLMPRHPKLKVIYLIRDPRAVLNSQAKIFGYFNLSKDIAQASSRHCYWLSQDLLQLQSLRDMYPNRVKVIRYEQGAINPYEYAEEIYRFLGLPITQSLTDFVNYLTSPKINNTTDYQSSQTEELPLKATAKKTRSEFKEIVDVPVQSKAAVHAELESKPARTQVVRKPDLVQGNSQGVKKPDLVQGNSHVVKIPGLVHGNSQVVKIPDLEQGRSQGVQKLDSKSRDNQVVQHSDPRPHAISIRSSGNIQRTKRYVKSKKFKYQTHREDPIHAMEHWRHEMGIELASVVDIYCGHLYPQLGYRMLTTQQDLENTAEIRTVDKPLVEGII